VAIESGLANRRIYSNPGQLSLQENKSVSDFVLKMVWLQERLRSPAVLST